MAEWTDGYWTVADGLRLHYRDYPGPADRPPILCLPGLTRNARDFEPLADHVAGRWPLLALDFRGRGLSDDDPSSERYLPPTYAGDVVALLEQRGIGRAVLVGTSLGGIVTMILAATNHDRLAGALINDVGPEFGAEAIERIRTYVGQDCEHADMASAIATVRRNNALNFPDYGEADWDRLAQRLCRERGGKLRFDYDPAIADNFGRDSGEPPDMWPLVDALAGIPVTILRGELSDLFLPTVAEAMAARVPGAELVTVPRVGHAPTFDEPESLAAFDRLLERVLQSQTSRSS